MKQRIALAAFVLVGLAGLVSLAACRPDVSVMEVRVLDERLLEVALDTCNADVSVEVREYDDRVEVDPRWHDRPLIMTGSDDCQDVIRVELQDSLGSRAVTNTSGEAFPVTHQ